MAGSSKQVGASQDYLHLHFVLMRSSWHEPGAVPGADADTYRVLNHAWSVDKNRVYQLGKALKNADRDNFTVLNDLFARDAQRLFCKGSTTTAVVDVNGFEPLDPGFGLDSGGAPRYEGYARDSTKVYFASYMGRSLRAVTGADPQTFRSVGHGFGLDSKSVFRHGKRLAGVKPEGFEILNQHYARTGNAVIFGDTKVADAIPGEFKLIDEYRGRDSKQVFESGRAQARGARTEPASSGRSIFAPLIVIVVVLGGLLIWLYEKLTWWRTPAEGEKAASAEDVAQVRKLAEVLANGDREAMTPVLLAIDDMQAFIEQYGERETFGDEPDYAELIGNLDEDDELPSYAVLLEVYPKRHLLGIIDWRSDTDETRGQVDPMLHRMGVRDFDWSFIDVLDEHGDGTELKNNNFLSILRDRLGIHGLTLAHIDHDDDGYGFAVLRKEDLATIDGLSVEGQFAVSADFGADDSYQRGTRILERILPARA